MRSCDSLKAWRSCWLMSNFGVLQNKLKLFRARVVLVVGLWPFLTWCYSYLKIMNRCCVAYFAVQELYFFPFISWQCKDFPAQKCLHLKPKICWPHPKFLLDRLMIFRIFLDNVTFCLFKLRYTLAVRLVACRNFSTAMVGGKLENFGQFVCVRKTMIARYCGWYQGCTLSGLWYFISYCKTDELKWNWITNMGVFLQKCFVV